MFKRLLSWRRHSRGRQLENEFRPRSARLCLEALERREVLSTFLVNTLNDSIGVAGQLSLRDAITQANTAGGSNTITFAGNVTGTISLNNAAGALPTITNDLTIQGPGAGSLTVQRPSSAAAFRIFVTGPSTIVTIAGLTISGGQATGTNNKGGGIFSSGTLTVQNAVVSGNAADSGGGLYSEDGPMLTILNSTISGNSATGSGGGVGDFQENVIIQNSTISGNSASEGGGVYLSDGQLTIQNSTISMNTAQVAAGSALGGGIAANEQGAVIIQNTTITGNTASGTGTGAGKGGGIYTSLSEVSLTNSTISGNTASGVAANGAGGGIFSNGSRGGPNYGDITLESCTLSGNTATSSALNGEGGGVYTNAGPLVVANTTIAGNTASTTSTGFRQGIGGGVFVNTAPALLQNSTLTGNTASSIVDEAYGGGVYLNSGQLTVRNCTIAANAANGRSANGASGGGGLRVRTGTAALTNTIIAQNTTSTQADGPDIQGTVASANHNLIGDLNSGATLTRSVGNLTGTDAAPLDPKLGALTTNGGPTQTMALLANSPAIDAGDDSVLINNPLTSDQRGAPFVRLFGSHVDIGAFEVQPAGATAPPIPPTPPAHSFVVTTTNDTIGVAGSLSLRDAIIAANAAGGSNTITFAAGVTGAISLNNAAGALPTIADDLTIQGPGAGVLTVQRPSTAAAFSIFSIAPAFTVTIAGLTISGGQAPGTTGPTSKGGGINNLGVLTVQNAVISGSSAFFGGGLYSSGPVLTVVNTTISGCAAVGAGATAAGGGIAVQAGLATIQSCTLSGNSVTTTNGGTAEGGGLYDRAGVVTILNTTISGNTTQDQGTNANGAEGAGVYDCGGVETIQSCTISGNTCNGSKFGEGGAVYNDVGVIDISNTVISGNQAVGANGDGEGGGVYNDSGTIVLQSCTITGNTARCAVASGANGNGEGGGVYADATTVIIENSTISGNTATTTSSAAVTRHNGEGGGVYVDAAQVLIQNTTITGNTASSENGSGLGGGVYLDSSSLTIRNCTIAANQATGPGATTGGGGLFVRPVTGTSTQTASVTNTIVATNTTSTAANGPDLGGKVGNANHDLIGVVNSAATFGTSVGNLSGTQATPLDPKLGPPANNGGTTTGATGSTQVLATMALLTGSSAIDAGDDSVTTNNPLTSDERGAPFVRLFGPHVDIGAFELQATTGAASLTGTLFLDFAASGVHNPTEPGFPGKTVFLDANGSGARDPGEPFAVTDASGAFSFPNVTPGTYTLSLDVLPAHGFLYTVSVPGRTLSLVGGAATMDLGVVPISQVIPPTGTAPDLFATHPNADADTAFLRGLYHTILGRNAEDAGLANWLAYLHGGASRAQVTHGIWNSPEHRTQEVVTFYLTYLRRAPDPVGLAGWVGGLMGGLSEETVAFYFITLPEYSLLHPDSASFADALYLDVLSRADSAAEQAAVASFLAGGGTRAALATAYIHSDESHLRGIDSFYEVFLHRPGEAAGRASWLTNLQTGFLNDASTAQLFFLSAEFATDAAGAVP
jgi:hypothetical protein